MTQIQMVLGWLKTGASITSQEAFKEFGCTRLADIIFKLRNKGYEIVTDTVDGRDRFGNPVRFARYRLLQ